MNGGKTPFIVKGGTGTFTDRFWAAAPAPYALAATSTTMATASSRATEFMWKKPLVPPNA